MAQVRKAAVVNRNLPYFVALYMEHNWFLIPFPIWSQRYQFRLFSFVDAGEAEAGEDEKKLPDDQ